MFGARDPIATVHEPRHLARKHALRVTLLGRRLRRRLEGSNRFAIEKREVLQVRHHIAIVGVEPELIELERRGPIRIQPDRSGFGLPKLHAGRGSHQREHQPVRLGAPQSANQIDPGNDVSPLIAATHL